MAESSADEEISIEMDDFYLIDKLFQNVSDDPVNLQVLAEKFDCYSLNLALFSSKKMSYSLFFDVFEVVYYFEEKVQDDDKVFVIAYLKSILEEFALDFLRNLVLDRNKILFSDSEIRPISDICLKFLFYLKSYSKTDDSFNDNDIVLSIDSIRIHLNQILAS